jgi:hypothetical protein
MDQPNSVVDCCRCWFVDLGMVLAVGLTMPNGGRRDHGASNHRDQFSLSVAVAARLFAMEIPRRARLFAMEIRPMARLAAAVETPGHTPCLSLRR